MADARFSAVPGIFFCFAATVLLIFVSISSPTWEKISFLDVVNGNTVTHFGVFGFTGSKVGVGYDFAPKGLRFDNARINTPATHNLTKSLIIHPIAAGLSGLAVLFGLCESRHHDRRSRRSRPGTILMSLCAALAAILTFAAFIIDMVLFGTVRKRFRDQGIPAQYGNANWLTIGALASLLLAFCLGICGVMHRHRKY